MVEDKFVPSKLGAFHRYICSITSGISSSIYHLVASYYRSLTYPKKGLPQRVDRSVLLESPRKFLCDCLKNSSLIVILITMFIFGISYLVAFSIIASIGNIYRFDHQSRATFDL